jgi:hypothetical protein
MVSSFLMQVARHDPPGAGLDSGGPGGLQVTDLNGTVNPVPEPAALLSVGVGGVILLAYARRRRRTAA